MTHERRTEIAAKVRALLAEEPEATTDLFYVLAIWDKESDQVGVTTTIDCCPYCMAHVLDIVQRLHLGMLAGAGDTLHIDELRDNIQKAKRN